jgi:hypothetical protein
VNYRSKSPQRAVDEITEFLDSCTARHIMLREGSRYLALALPTAGVA